MGRSIVLPFLILGVAAQQVAAQCMPPHDSNEAKLLAFYEAPLAFSPATAPQLLPAGSIRIGGELAPVPTPDPELERTSICYEAKGENTRLSPVFARPRIAVTLPYGFQVEASYLPPVTIADAQPNLGSLALSYTRQLPVAPAGYPLLVTVRTQGTIGRVRGPITCPESELQVSDPNAPCYGQQPSRDTFKPRMIGAEGAVGTSTHDGRLSAYAGAGIMWLRPRFQVGFTDGAGNIDRTQIVVNLRRATVFGGLAFQVARAIDLSAQLYAVPADAVTWRFGAGWRLR
jgi:hypothetical protein